MSSEHIARVRDTLEAAGIEVDEVRSLPTGLGQQLRCAGGQVVVLYNTGKSVAQGKDAARVKALLDGMQGPVKKPAPPKAPVRTPSASPGLPGPTRTAGESLAAAPTSWARQNDQVYWTDLPWNGTELPWDPVG